MHTYVAFSHHLIACRTGGRGNPDGGGPVGDIGTRSNRGASREEQPGEYEQQPYEEHWEYLGDANFGWGAYPEQGRHLCIPPSK